MATSAAPSSQLVRPVFVRSPPKGLGDQPVYGALAEFQQSAEWDFAAILVEFRTWFRRFNRRFNLGLPEFAVIGVERLNRRCLGKYLRGHNGLGLRTEILIDRTHIETCIQAGQFWQVLGTLLHEALHCHQELYGRPGKSNYHNKEFRRRAADYGLIVASNGVTRFDTGDTPFLSILREHGVAVETPEREVPLAATAEKKAPKLALWVCGCRPPVRLRVGRTRLNAVCGDCGQQFERASYLPVIQAK